MSFRITTVAKEHGEDEGRGILMYAFDKCLDISYTNEVSSWYIGREAPNEFGTGFMLRLGRLWIEYTGGLDNVY